MTNYTWTGATSNSANNSANWVPAGIPAAGDVVIFDGGAIQNCVWDIATPTAPTLSVDEMILEETFIRELSFSNIPRIKGMFLNGRVAPGGGVDTVEFYHGASPNFFGSYKTYNEKFLLIADNGNAEGITMEMYGSATPITKFDDGQHPDVELVTGNFAPDYSTPTSTSGKASFDSFTVTSPAVFEPDGALTDNDRLKTFSFSAFAITSTSINFGLSTVEFYATSGDFPIPTKNNDIYGLDFEAYYRKIILKTTTVGWKCVLGENTFLSLEELEIDDGVVFKGPVDNTSQGAEIRSTKSPKIRGTWSFSQVSQGIYRSPRHAPNIMLNKVVEFDTGIEVDVTKAGEMRWDENAQTVALGAVNGVHAHLGQTFQYNVKNQTGGTLTEGTVVQAVGTVGSSARILIDAMDASGTGDAKLIVGVLQEDVPTGSDSVALSLGKLRGVDLTSLKPVSETWADGDVLYCDQANDGGLTNVRPSSGIILAVAFILNYAGNGSLAVRALPIDEGATGGGGGGGTVTSVDMSVPTGFTISGNPITSTGTLALAFDTGYALPTSAKQTQWDTAYGWGDHSTQGYLTSSPPETDPVFSVHPASGITVAGGGDVSKGETAFGWGDHGAAGYLTSFTEADPVFTASEANLFIVGDAAKLAGIEANAQVNVPLQHMRLYGINTGSNLHTVTSGSRVYLDLGDATKFAESTTGSHPDITVTNAATDYITIAAGGIYQITGHVSIFPATAPSSHDIWIEYNTNTSANRELGVSRMQHASNSTGNMNYKHSTVVEVPSTASDMDIYISVFSNGATANVRAYDNNRFFFTITRIGDSTV